MKHLKILLPLALVLPLTSCALLEKPLFPPTPVPVEPGNPDAPWTPGDTVPQPQPEPAPTPDVGDAVIETVGVLGGATGNPALVALAAALAGAWGAWKLTKKNTPKP